MVGQSRLKREHQEPEDQAARPYMVKAALPEPQSWRKVPILRDAVIARIRWDGRKGRCAHTACIGASLQGAGSDERGTSIRSDDQRKLGDGLNRESGRVTEEREESEVGRANYGAKRSRSGFRDQRFARMSEKTSRERNNPFWRALGHGNRACQVREGAVGNVITTHDVDHTRWPPTSFYSGKN